jgi:hypothetical protein
VLRTLAVTTLPQSASAEAALVGVALVGVALASAVGSVAGLDSVVALASIVDSGPAPSPSIAVSGLGLDSVVALASIVDSDPALSPSTAVLDLGLAFTADSIVGLHSVDLVVDGKLDRRRLAGRSTAGRYSRGVDRQCAIGRQPISRGRRCSGKTKGRQVPAPCWFS